METQTLSIVQHLHLSTEESTFLEQTRLLCRKNLSKERRYTMSRFSLPLEKGLTLTREMLNSYSTFRRQKKPYLMVRIRKIDYQQEVLVIGVSIADEAEEKIFLQVQLGYLLIACSVNTNESYLSRYAYHALEQLISSSDHYDFARFYWPGFFNVKTGKSRYLDIINDRHGMDIKLKPRYSPFYKPGQRLYHPSDTFEVIARQRIEPAATNLFSEQGIGLGYCLADTHLKSFHSNHWPFLVPYTLKPTKNGKKVKSFIGFVKDEADLLTLDYPAAQTELNQLCYEMLALAPIASTSRLNTETENEQIHFGNLSNRDKLFLLWQRALPWLVSQQFTHHMHTYGIRNVKGKPNRVYMDACTFSAEVPRLCFSWRDRGGYFELKLLFKVRNKVLKPERLNTAFFICSSDETMQFYLLNSLQDFYVMGLFDRYNNCISVFKCHYEEHFKSFKEQLEKVYELV